MSVSTRAVLDTSLIAGRWLALPKGAWLTKDGLPYRPTSSFRLLRVEHCQTCAGH